MKSLRQYSEDSKLAESLRRLNSIAEFQGLKKVLKEMYTEDLRSLAERENPEARFRCKFVTDLLDNIDTKIKLGEIAAEEIAAGRFEPEDNKG